jgi:hypothetical protein
MLRLAVSPGDRLGRCFRNPTRAVAACFTTYQNRITYYAQDGKDVFGGHFIHAILVIVAFSGS